MSRSTATPTQSPAEQPVPHEPSTPQQTPAAVAVLHDTPFLCAACNYPLRQLSEYRCPECGQAFDPHDITTVNAGKPLTPAARNLLRPVGGWFLTWVVILAIATLIFATGPEIYFLPFLICMGCWLLTGLWWGVRFVGCLFSHWKNHQPLFLHQRKWLQWALAPIVVIGTVGLLELRVPFYVAFLISKPALDRFVTEVTAKPDAEWADQWIGLFPVRDIEESQDGMVRFVVDGTGFLGAGGLEYRPENSFMRSGPFRLRKQILGNWYRYVEEF